MKNIFTFCLFLFLIVGCKNEPKSEESSLITNEESGEEPIATKVAYANGFQNFEDVEQLSFTFNVKVNDTVRSQRAWKWFPVEDRVELTENGQTSSYINDGEFDEQEKTLDQKFINDTYWLLFPFQLVWSEYDLSHNRKAIAPISGEEMEMLSVSFANEGGYTPGDTYHIYLKDDMIQEWTYESSNGRELSTTWEDYETFNGITIAKTHKSQDGSFQLYFTDIEVIKAED